MKPGLSFGKRSLVVGLVAFLGLGLTTITAPAATAADPTAAMSLTKVARAADGSDVTNVIPGQAFAYRMQFQCTAGVVSGCINASLVDPLPPYLEIVGTPAVSGTAAPTSVVTVTGTTITVKFNADLGEGDFGLDAGSPSVLQVPVRVRQDIPFSQNGVPLHNVATLAADNTGDPNTAFVDVTPRIPVDLGATTTKVINPAGALPVPGTPLSTALTGQNTSNAAVDTLTISDPVDPTADPNPFTYLGLTSLGTVTLPSGAETVQVRAFVNGAFVDGAAGATPSLPAGVDPADITGLQFVFRSTANDGIAIDSTAAVGLNMAQRDNVTELAGPLTIKNDAHTTVALGATTATSAPASDTYRIPPSALSVDATKTFTPDTVTAGGPSTVALGATNSSEVALDSLTIAEPSQGSPNPFEGGGLVFTGLGSNGQGAGIQWPTGATAASITYTCAATGPGAPQPTTAVDTLPSPPVDCSVLSFSTSFTGAIAAGAAAKLPFTVTTSVTQGPDELTRSNEVGVTGALGATTATATASDDITSIKERLAVAVTKKVSPAQLPSVAGQIATVQLSGTLQPFPASTTDAHQLIVQDPANFGSDQWWGAFQAKSVTATPVPAASTLTVQYWTGTDWVDVPTMTGIAGPTIFSGELPAAVKTAAQGIRFVYNSDQGFPPGTQVKPNLTSTLRSSQAESNATVTDCAVSAASNGALTASAPPAACAPVQLVVPEPGGGDLVDKNWDSPVVNARTQNQVGATLHWSTGGYSGLDSEVVSDTQDAATTPLTQSVFDTFDLVKIDPITAAADPLLTYDQVSNVELYRLPAGGTDPAAGSWVKASASTCPAACDGNFPGVALTAAERASTIGFRLTFVESPTRGARTGSDPNAPTVGSGVAASAGNNRQIHPVFAIRDALRSNAQVPITADTVTNIAGRPGEVRNTVRASGFAAGALRLDDTDSDDIAILDVPVTVKAGKTWTGGPLGIPAAGVPANRYPSGRVTLTAQNTTPAKIDQLVISDPTGGSNPFDAFALTKITSISTPASVGATDVTVTLTDSITGAATYTRAQALALTSAQLANVIGMSLNYAGRITAGATATVAFDTQLLPASRSSNLPPTAGQTFTNAITTTAADLVGYAGVTPKTATDGAQASISTVAQGIGVTTTKTFNPTTQTEPDNGPVAITLAGQPSGPSRTTTMTLTDNSPTFWNQYDLSALSPISFTAPINQVRVDAFTGGTWSVVAGAPVLTGGSWQTGAITAGPNLTLPSGVTSPQVQGLRFTFTKADGTNWENPATPRQPVSFTVKRRATLNTGGPVTSNLAGSLPAPGETVAGQATNDTSATVLSSDVDIDGNPLTATSTARATINYLHATNAVTVNKTPNGDNEQPGVPFTYTLTVKNTGQTPIVNPVITDRLPTDGNGAQVVFSDVGNSPRYTYALAPTSNATTALPVVTADVTVAETATSMRFSFPAGSQLEVGETYTIQFLMQTRAGLAANTAFTNSFGVTGDRAWDQCSGQLDAGTGECRATATNTVTSAGALAIKKVVKAEGSDLLGVLKDPSVTSGGACSAASADSFGFFARPCIPVAKPGGAITWQMQIVNTGNRDVDRVVTIDRLPTSTGDRLATQNLARGSQWAPVLTGAVPTLDSNGATGPSGTLNAFYTLDTIPCTADLGTDASLCPAGAWIPWSTGLPADRSAVTGVKLEFLPTTPLLAAQRINIDMPMTAPAFSPTAGADTISFNTVGMSGRFINGARKGYTLTTEPPRVGVALATGPLQVVKRVTGDAAAQYAPDTFPATLQCTSVGQRVALGTAAALTLTPDVPVTVHSLPYGARCTVAEGDLGQTASSATTATVVRDLTDVQTSTLTNVYDYASLSIEKKVVSKAVDAAGNPVSYGPFTATVSCTFRGNPVFADGFSAAEPMTVELSDGGKALFTKLPAGADCAVRETDAKGASTTSIVATAGAADPVTTPGTSAPITLAPDTTAGVPVNSIVITNSFDVGSVRVAKVVTGSAADIYGAGPFTVGVTCTLTDDSGTRVVYQDDAIVLGGEQPLDKSIPNVAAGATCLVAESESAGASAVAIDQADAVAADGTVTATITNSFVAGELRLSKTVTGDAANYAPATFSAEVSCSAAGEVLPGFPKLVSIEPPAPATVATLVGATCTAAETTSAGATAITYQPTDPDDDTRSGPVVVGDEPAIIGITNQYRAGGLDIVKRIEGPGASIGADPFSFAVACSFNGRADAFTKTVTIERSGSATTLTSDPITGLPVGATCVITETGSGGADHVAAPVTVTIPDVDDSGAAQVVHAGFVNAFSAGHVQISKVIAGAGAEAARNKVFAVLVTCQLADPDNGLLTLFSGTVRLKGGQTIVVKDAARAALLLPAGARCFARETENGGAGSSVVDFDSYQRGAVVGVGNGLETLAITVTNTFGAVAPPPPTSPPSGPSTTAPSSTPSPTGTSTPPSSTGPSSTTATTSPTTQINIGGQNGNAGGELPNTGVPGMKWAGFGLMTLLAGIVLLFAARRRQMH